jgi:hypothetical protein
MNVMTIANTIDIEVEIVNSGEQAIARHWPPTILMGYEEPLPEDRVDNEVGFDSSNQYVNGWLSFIKEELYSNPSVEDIFVDIEGGDVDVWVVIPERDLTILDQIVEAEGELFDTLVSGESPPFLIEFHVIYRCGRNVEELAPTKAIRLPR